jgi:integrase
MQNLERRPSGIYVARLTIPSRLRSIVGSAVFIASTGTRHLPMAKLVAGELLAGWRRQLFDLERLALASTSMNENSIVRIADGHPLLRSPGYLPLLQAAAVLGLSADDLLRKVADGGLSLFYRFVGDSGYLTAYHEFEPDDAELRTVVVPGVHNRPANSRLHTAFGIFRLLTDDAMALASALLAKQDFAVLVVEALEPADSLNVYVPSKSIHPHIQSLEISTIELESFRRLLAESITSLTLDGARIATQAKGPDASKAKLPLSEAISAYGHLYLPRMVTSAKEIERIQTGIRLLSEFEGDLVIGSVTADTLRHFRDRHLSTMPANENRARIRFETRSMTESVEAIKGTDWPMMSAGERDQRMQWICRMFRWFHGQKWIVDDPSTGLRGESVLTKAERSRVATSRSERQEFTLAEIETIFSSQVFQMEKLEQTRAGTFRTFQPFHYWLPLLGLFTGARIGEITQLHLDDVRCDDGVWFLDINKNSNDKSLKNSWSIRRVPLHPDLLNLGFTKWTESLKSGGYVRLFPELSWNETNRYAKEPIRAMSRFLEKAGMPRDGTKVFHSFRHGMNNQLQKRSAMPDIMRKRLMGHEPGEGVNERHYLSDPSPSDMLAYIAKLQMGLPQVSRFEIEAGLKAIEDALRRKNGGRGAKESLGSE